MDGLPVTIRLLDPPLHEFLPDGDLDEIVALLAQDTGTDENEIVERIEKLTEVNPMLGFRGCRLAITYPEIGKMVRCVSQIQTLFAQTRLTLFFYNRSKCARFSKPLARTRKAAGRFFRI
jgi:hypothetical protein